MALTEYNWERFYQQQVENKENKVEKGNEKEQALEKEDTHKKKFKKVKPEDAHRYALSILDDKRFARILKNCIGELIVHKENITRIDFMIDETHDEEMIKTYGLTKDHFEDILNGNLTSFEVKPDGDDLSLYFNQHTGEQAIRPIDDTVLAHILDLIFTIMPDKAPSELQPDVVVN